MVGLTLSTQIEAQGDLTERRSGTDRRSGHDRRSGDRRQEDPAAEQPPPPVTFRGTVEPSRAVDLLRAVSSALEFVTPWQLEE